MSDTTLRVEIPGRLYARYTGEKVVGFDFVPDEPCDARDARTDWLIEQRFYDELAEAIEGYGAGRFAVDWQGPTPG